MIMITTATISLQNEADIIGMRLCDIIITSTMIAAHNSIATAITIANTSPEPALGPVDQKCLQN
jgi:hypothetical protein